MLRNLNQLASGQRICGTPKSGVLGSLIPSTGDNGPGYAYNDLSLPADNNKEIRGLITTWPSAGTLFAYEDTSFEFDAPDGSYSFQYQLYVDGVAVGSPATVSLQVGPVTHAATSALSASSATIAAEASRETIRAASGVLSAQPSSVSGAASRYRAHAAESALSSSGATVSAVSARDGGAVTHAATSAVIAQPSAISATAARVGAAVTHSASGQVSASPAIISSIALRNATHAAIADLFASSALVSGSARIGEIGARTLPLSDSRTLSLTSRRSLPL